MRNKIFSRYKTAAAALLLGGVMLLHGKQVGRNDPLREKAAAGDPEAAFYLGNEYFYGENRPANLTLAVYWYKKAADTGIPEAQYNYASCLESGRGIKKNLADAFAWYKKAADRNFQPASFRVAQFHLTGVPDESGRLILQPDVKSGLAQLEKLADEQYEPAEIEWAAMRMGRHASPDDHRKAFALLNRITGRKQCDPRALRMLADCYFTGIGCPTDRDKAVKLLNAAAKRKDPEALAKLGFLYEYGHGVKADPEKSRECYRKAAEAGHPMAQFKYAEAMSEGQIPGKNLNDALPWYRKSAAGNCPQAIFKLGVFYHDGLGVRQNKQQAARLFFQAARRGYVRAQYNLACLFDEGVVNGKPDKEAAFYWFQQAARGGDVTAQRRVGECYLNGTGVDQSLSKAEQWLVTAARNGDFNARELLYRIQRSSAGSSF